MQKYYLGTIFEIEAIHFVALCISASTSLDKFCLLNGYHILCWCLSYKSDILCCSIIKEQLQTDLRITKLDSLRSKIIHFETTPSKTLTNWYSVMY